MAVDGTVSAATCQEPVKDAVTAMAIDGTQDAACEDFGFQQPGELPAEELLWPSSDVQQPEVVYTVDEFIDTVFFQTHIDRVVVLRNGINLLRQQNGIPEKLRKAVAKSRTIRQFLDEVTSDGKDEFRGRLWHYSNAGAEKEVKSEEKTKALSDKNATMKKQEADGEISQTAPIYVSEVRYSQKVWHPIATDEFVKTATQCDVYDVSPLARAMPIWERSEGGIFFGERGTGSGLHIDQCMWSNVGRNWCGYKLFAIWPWEDRFRVVEEYGKGRMFPLPLSDQNAAALRQAKTVALLHPGDAFVFSGAQPHGALVVGDGLNITAYESFCPANATAVGTLVRSNIKDMHPKNFWMDDEDLDELYEDVVDNLQRALRGDSIDQRMRSRLEECVAVMREKGDAYCRELWNQEDTGGRRRRREESDSSSSDSQSAGGSEGSKQRPATPSANFSDGPKILEDCDGDTGPKCKKVRSCSEPADSATSFLLVD